MSRVLISAQTGASVHVFAADHCPPHVHAWHRGDGWTARVRFSFITDQVGVMSVTLLNREPRPSVIGALVREVHQRLLACRQAWWAMHSFLDATTLIIQAGTGLEP